MPLVFVLVRLGASQWVQHHLALRLVGAHRSLPLGYRGLGWSLLPHGAARATSAGFAAISRLNSAGKQLRPHHAFETNRKKLASFSEPAPFLSGVRRASFLL